MAKSAKNTGAERKYLAEQDEKVAMQIKEVLCFFHSEVLHGFIALTMLKSLLLIIFLILGYSVPRAARLLGFCPATVRSKKALFKSGQMKQIFYRKPGSGRKSACASKQDEIISVLESRDYQCVRQIQKMIEEKICASVSLAAVKAFLHRLGYTWLKCGSLPAKADPEVQREFYDKTEKPLMERAKNGEVHLLYVDASHFVMGNIHLGYVWSKQRRFLSTFTGRVRYNVLGALNFATKEMTTVTNNTYITATQVVELLDKLAKKYADRPIILILDNASYQKCNFVQEHARALGIKLEFLPPYSPNLNLIERFWKLVKKELGCAYFNDFEAFCRNIDLLCNSTHTELKAKMDTLIGDKVQLFDGMIQKSAKSMEKPGEAA